MDRSIPKTQKEEKKFDESYTLLDLIAKEAKDRPYFYWYRALALEGMSLPRYKDSKADYEKSLELLQSFTNNVDQFETLRNNILIVEKKIEAEIAATEKKLEELIANKDKFIAEAIEARLIEKGL